MSVMDELAPKMAELQQPQSTTRQVEFFKLTMSANPTKLPSLEHYALYREMQMDMLSQLKTQVQLPDPARVRATVEKFETTFTPEKAEARAPEHAMDAYISALAGKH